MTRHSKSVTNAAATFMMLCLSAMGRPIEAWQGMELLMPLEDPFGTDLNIQRAK